MLRNLLLYRIIVANSVIIAGLIWAFMHGYVQVLFAGETTGFGYFMVVVFVLAMAGFFLRAYKTSMALNSVKAGMWVDVRKFRIKSSFVPSVGVWLVTLGLMGNIIGFAQAVESLDLTGGAEAAMTAITHMVDGMKVAFYTTLIGTALGLWMAINGHILNTAISLLGIDAESIAPRRAVR